MNREITVTDRRHMVLRIIEALIGMLFLAFVVFVAPLKDAGWMAIPVVLVPIALILDGLGRFFVLKKGVIIDRENDLLTYPKHYRQRSIKLSDIGSTIATKTLHTGSQLNSSTYSYDLKLQGAFGEEVLIFSSKEMRDLVRKSLQETRSPEGTEAVQNPSPSFS